MKTAIYIIIGILVGQCIGMKLNYIFIHDAIQQSKEHHQKYHELIKENYRLNEWYQNHSNNTDCDTFKQPTSVSINCEKYEL